MSINPDDKEWEKRTVRGDFVEMQSRPLKGGYMAKKSRYKKYAEGIHVIHSNRQKPTNKVQAESVLEKLKNAKEKSLQVYEN